MTNPEKNQSKSPLTGDVLRILVILFAVLIFALAPGISQAAKITFDPGSIAVAMSPGDEKVISFTANFSDQVRSDSKASFYVALTNGSISRTWVTRSDFISLDGLQTSGDVSLKVTVPSGVQTGTYTGVIRPIGIRANERTTTEVLSLYIEVMDKKSCSQPPVISDIVAEETIVRSRNKKPLTFEFSGNITSQPGCTTENAYYTLTDEYGELDKTESMQLDEAGNFKVEVEVIASRKGRDKNGRLYTVTFGADNEAGTVVGGEQSIIISHDNRK